MEEENLEAILGVKIEGIDDIKQYTAALREATRAENAAARASAAYAQARSQLGQVQAQLQAAGGSPVVMGSGGSGGGVSISIPASSRAPRAPKWTREEQAIYSSRFNLPGGAAPLFGKTLEAAIGPAAAKSVISGMAPLAKAAGPIALAFTVAKGAIESMAQAARESAAITNRITSAQATAGGSASEVARLGLMGGSADAARSFQERITSDPQAMSAAARVGVRNQRGIYGNLNWSGQYLRAIENTSKIADESMRRRLALQLGIEQEVAQYSLLSEETRRRLADSAKVTGQINDPEAQRRAAEYQASSKEFTQASENAKNALGQLFMDDITGVLNEFADGANSIAQFFKRFRPSNRRYKTPLGALTFGLLGDPGYDAPGGSAAGKSSPMMANTQALQANTEAVARLNGTIGGGQNTREALPSALRGQQLHDALVSRSLRLGALG